MDQVAAAVDEAALELSSVIELPALDPVPAEGRTRGRASTPSLELEVEARPGEQRVVLEMDSVGRLRWHLPERGANITEQTRAGAPDRFVIPVDGVPTRDGTRSRRLRTMLYVLRFPVELAAGWAATQTVALWEQRHRPHSLHLLNADGTRGADATPHVLAQLDDGPFLLLVHGLFGLGASTFEGLLGDGDTFGFLHHHYSGRTLVFDHPSVHVSPAQNVAWLRDHLPVDRPLRADVVAHSRGGIVSRELARQHLPLQLGSVVHVGVPNAGTMLASPERLGMLLDVVTNLVALFPEPSSSTVLRVVLEVVKQAARGVLGGLAGISAMNPADAGLVELNRLPASSGVKAITTDHECGAGSSLAAQALDRAVDVLIGAPNDLVVPTRGVFEAGSWLVAEPMVAQAPAHLRPLTHSSFFRDTSVRQQISRWLAVERPGAASGPGSAQ